MTNRDEAINEIDKQIRGILDAARIPDRDETSMFQFIKLVVEIGKSLRLINELDAENKQYREALGFYADTENYEPSKDYVVGSRSTRWHPRAAEVLFDKGDRAKQALSGQEG